MTRHSKPNTTKRDAGYKLPRTPIPEPILPGVKGWQTPDHWTVLRVHYTADPEVDNDWIKDRSTGYRGGTGGRDWQREMEISFQSYAGEPVYPRFTSESVRPTEFDPELELWRGWDFGFRHPAVVWLQYDVQHDHLKFLHELYPTLNAEEVPGINTHDLCALVRAATNRYFPEVNETGAVRDFVDPAGLQHQGQSDYSNIEILTQEGFAPEWVKLGRKNRINYARHWVEDSDRFSINPSCPLMAKALSGAYRYPEDSKGTVDRDVPDLSKRVQEEPYVHIMDAFEYVVAGALQLDDVSDPSAWQRTDDQEQMIGDLAEMYLRASRQPVREYDTHTLLDDEWSDYEVRPSDLIGEDDLADAWKVT